MKRIALTLVSGLLTTISVHAQFNTELIGLPTLQQKYVGHKVIVESAALRCVDQVATVQQITPIAGTAYANPASRTTTNALGEVVSQPPAVQDVPLVIVVLCPDGLVAKSTYLQSLVPKVLRLADNAETLEAARVRLQKQIDSSIGSSIYAVRGAKVYSITSSMSDLAHKQGSFTPSYLAPLKIVTVKLVDFEGHTLP